MISRVILGFEVRFRSVHTLQVVVIEPYTRYVFELVIVIVVHNGPMLFSYDWHNGKDTAIESNFCQRFQHSVSVSYRV